MRTVLGWVVLSGLAFSARVYELYWPDGRTFSRYLAEHNQTQLLSTITAEDMQYVAEIQAGERYYELRDGEVVLQALIPIGEEMQIQLRREPGGGYRFDIVPIVFREVTDTVSFPVLDGYQRQIDRHTHYPGLKDVLVQLYKGALSFQTLQPEDRIAFTYTQKERLGVPLGKPRIKGALIDTHGKEHFVFVPSRGEVYRGVDKAITVTRNEKRPFTYTTVRKVPSAHFRMPLVHPRITSRFTYRRWHPILHKYRPHFGVDFGAKRGTPLRAVNDGKVIYAGWMRGYGKVVKIDHGRGFVSLYAHQSKILVKLRQQVKRGQVIGRVGSTGRSTGPHLHFGLYHHGKPVNPLHYIDRRGTGKTRSVVVKHTVMKTYPVTRKRYVRIRGARTMKKRLHTLIRQETTDNEIWSKRDRNVIRVRDILIDQELKQGDHHG